MRKLFVIAATACLTCPLLAQTTAIEGCLASQGGQYVLVQQNPARVIALRGRERMLASHVGQLVSLTGRTPKGQNDQNLREFWVSEAEEKGSRCPEPISGALPSVPVAGKAGNRETSTPTTTSSAAMQTTPGLQTEAGYEQAPGGSTMPRTGAPPRSSQAAAPPNMAMANQTADTADLGAQAAARAEYGPHTLGVGSNSPQQNGPQGDQANAGPLDQKSQIGYQSQVKIPPTAPETGYPNPRNVDADTLAVASSGRRASPFPTTVGQPRPSAVISILKEKLNPLQVTIKPGQTVLWTNNSGAKVAKLQDETGKFIAEQLSPGASFAHTFDQPGRYEYSLYIGDRRVTGAVIVRP